MKNPAHTMPVIGVALFWIAAAALGVLSAPSCSDDCAPTDTRCDGETVEICSSDGDRWETLMDCAEIWGGAASWVCCEDHALGGYTCTPADECGQDGGEK